jgi:hypothetical protein
MTPTTLPTADAPPEVPDPWRCDAMEVVRILATDPVRGLSEAEIRRRLARDGPNELRAQPRRPLWRRMLSQFEDPLVYLLLAAGGGRCRCLGHRRPHRLAGRRHRDPARRDAQWRDRLHAGSPRRKRSGGARAA